MVWVDARRMRVQGAGDSCLHVRSRHSELVAPRELKDVIQALKKVADGQVEQQASPL
jgi:hypothetical protein